MKIIKKKDFLNFASKLLKKSEIKDLLDLKYEQFNSTDFIATDPIQIPHQLVDKKDIEIMGLLVALIAWGNRKSIIKSGEKLLEIFGRHPYEYVMNANENQIPRIHFIHRTFQSEDLQNFVRAFKKYYSKNDSLETAFEKGESMSERIHHFKSNLGQYFNTNRTNKHLADPLKGSSAKRINMYLRWMVRKDQNGVDFGLWNNIPTSILHLPLDVHTGNVGRKLGLLKRKQNDWKAVEEITHSLRKFDAQDPCKYDFALFGLGAFEKF